MNYDQYNQEDFDDNGEQSMEAYLAMRHYQQVEMAEVSRLVYESIALAAELGKASLRIKAMGNNQIHEACLIDSIQDMSYRLRMHAKTLELQVDVYCENEGLK